MSKEPRIFNYLENEHGNMSCRWLGFLINKFPSASPHISKLKNTTLFDNTKNGPLSFLKKKTKSVEDIKLTSAQSRLSV